MMDSTRIAQFLASQIAHWNAGDKEGLFADYRAVASKGLRIDYVGRGESDGWPILEKMWERQPTIRAVPLVKIINGNEAACHVRNEFIGTDRAVHTIELFRFEEDVLFIRYFIQQG